VTGASGFLGGALCDALLARGDEVVGLSRDPDQARATNPTVSWFAWQATLERPPPEAFDGVDGVVNLVGEPLDQRWNQESKRRILESRRAGTHNLVQAIGGLKKRPRVLVSQSAIGYYGDRGDAIVDESTDPGSGFAAEVCVEWESAAHEADDLLRVVVIRTGLVLDRRNGLLKQLLTPFRLGVGGPIAGGNQYMSWIHVDDEISLLLWALADESVAGAINATAPNPVTNRELSKTLGRVLKRPAIMPVPSVALNMVLGRELAQTVRGGQRVLPRRALDLGFSFQHPALEPALRDLI
jgi:uncharacterized protein